MSVRRVKYFVFAICLALGMFAFAASKTIASPEAPLPGIWLTKTANVVDMNANGLTQPGDRIHYTIRITNTAVTSFTNVYVIDQLPPGSLNILAGTMSVSQGSIQQLIDPGSGNSYIRADLGSVNGSSVVTIDFEGQILASAASPINNSATVYQNAGQFIAQSNSTSTALDPGPDLRVSKQLATNLAFPGKILGYYISANKYDAIPANGVVITETVPTNTFFVASASTTGWSCADGSSAGTKCTLNLGDTTGNIYYYPYFAVRVNSVLTTSDATITNVVRIGDSGFYGADSNYSNNVYTLTTPLKRYNLVGVKSAAFVTDSYAQGSLDVGDVIQISIVVSNTGTENATGVTLSDQFGNSAMTVDGSSASISKGTGGCNYYQCSGSFGNIVPGESVTMTFRLTATLQYYYYPQYSNIADIFQDGNLVISTNQITLPIAPVADVSIWKSLVNCCSSIVSGSVPYMLNYGNTYNANYTATNVVITETIPVFAQFNSLASATGWNCIAYTCTYSLANPLPPNTSGQISFTVDLTGPLPASVDTLVNNAWIGMNSSATQDKYPGNNYASLSTRIGSPPVLTATTFAQFAFDGNLDGKLSIGDIVTFTTVITNISNRDANEVAVNGSGNSWMTIDKNSISISQGSLNGSWGNYFYASVGPILAGSQVTVTWRAQFISTPSSDVLQILTNLNVSDQRYGQSLVSTPAIVQVFVPSSSLSLVATKTAKFMTDTLGNGTADVGDVIEYAVVVTNTGSATANDVRVVDCFQGSQIGCMNSPAFWTVLAANGYSVSQGTASLNASYWSQNVTAQFGSLTPGDIATLTLRVMVTEALPTNATQIVNQAQVYAFSYLDPITLTNIVTIPVTPRIALSAHTSFYQRIITNNTEVLVFATYFSDDGNYMLPYQVGFTQSIPSGMRIYWPASSFYLACSSTQCAFGMPWSSTTENTPAYIAFSRVLSETQNTSAITTTAHAYAYQSGTDERNYADNFSTISPSLCTGPYEFNNTPDTANVIQVGEMQSQGFCYPYNWELDDYNSLDEDWVVFTVTTPGKYRIGFSNEDQTYWPLQSVLTLFASDGITPISSKSDGYPYLHTVEFTKTLLAGKYYVRVKRTSTFYGDDSRRYKLYVLLDQPLHKIFIPNTLRGGSLVW